MAEVELLQVSNNSSDEPAAPVGLPNADSDVDSLNMNAPTPKAAIVTSEASAPSEETPTENVEPGDPNKSLEADADEENADAEDLEIQQMKERMKQMEEEAKKIEEMQDQVESQAGTDSTASSSEVDKRSIYVGGVDYQVTPEELQSFFQSCGTVNRVTILCDKWGAPKGFAYVEFAEESGVSNAMLLNGAELHNRPLKIAVKRTNVPGYSRGRGRGRGGRRPYRGRGGYRGGYGARYRGRGRSRGWSPYG
eukprot:256221_1